MCSKIGSVMRSMRMTGLVPAALAGFSPRGVVWCCTSAGANATVIRSWRCHCGTSVFCRLRSCPHEVSQKGHTKGMATLQWKLVLLLCLLDMPSSSSSTPSILRAHAPSPVPTFLWPLRRPHLALAAGATNINDEEVKRNENVTAT